MVRRISVFVLLTAQPPPSPHLFPSTTLFRSDWLSHLPFGRLSAARATPYCARMSSSVTTPLSWCTLARLTTGSRSSWLAPIRSEEHTSELQSLRHLVCRLPLEKKNELHSWSP